MSSVPNASKRILSIDIFRGLVILVMIFVNDVAGVLNLPWWTYHIPPGQQGLTYVDIVFPAFLFIVGMSIPLAIGKRKNQGQSNGRIMYHVLIRSLSLIILGLLIMNGREVQPEATGISYAMWNVLMFVCVILVWNIYPKKDGQLSALHKGLKYAGIGGLLVLLIIYRRESQGTLVWIDPFNWSILGSIGLAYFISTLIYLVSKQRLWAIALGLVLLHALNFGMKLDFSQQLLDQASFRWPFGFGAGGSITLAGVIASLIFIRRPEGRIDYSIIQKFLYGILFMAGLFILGRLTMPFGLAKIGMTASYCFLSSGYSLLVFMLTFWLVDILKISKWGAFIKPAGSNPLLTYLLPDIYYAIFTVHHLTESLGSGWPGVIRSLLLTIVILGVSAIMTRLKIRLQL